jgi:selenocysteine lyase/cysteine desulfurase
MYGKYELLAELDGQYHYFYGKDKVPAKLEPGNPNYELAYSTDGIVDYFAALGDQRGASGSRCERLAAGFAAVARHENQLTECLLSWLRGRDDCHVIGETSNEDGNRVPTIAFKFDGLDSGDIARAVEEHGIAIRFGDFHSRRLIVDLDEAGSRGVLRVSMVHYNTLYQVHRLTGNLERIVAQKAG